MKRLIALFLGLAILASVGVACKAEGTSTGPSITPEPSITPKPSITPEQQKSVDAAKVKLAERLSIDQSKIILVSIQAVDWPDTSLGVSVPGNVYAQVITPGYKIILLANGVQYEYHTGTSGNNINVVLK